LHRETSSLPYTKLKELYLDKLHRIHPDKHPTKQGHDAFVELQSAWEAYGCLSKSGRRIKGNCKEGSFTMFGVGCSFSDSPLEQDLRRDFTDQACQGFIPNIAIPQHTSSKSTTSPISLCDDGMFSTEEEEDHIIDTDAKGFVASSDSVSSLSKSQRRTRKNLIDASFPNIHKKY